MLFGSAGWYAAMASHPRSAMDWNLRYDKRRKSTHRFAIADHGRVRELTVPVSRPEGGFASGRLTWGEILLSPHGRWWETIPETLATAYGRTPFFEYYAPKFEELWAEPAPGALLRDFASKADSIVRSILGIGPEEPPEGEIDDLRSLPADLPCPNSYWQPHSGPFIPGLSVLDLIFSTGPEAPLYLRHRK